MTLMPLMKKLDLHSRHIDAGRALSPATFATDAEVHGFFHVVGGESTGSQLAGERQAKIIGPSACDVLFIAGCDVTGAHHACVGLTAGAIVVTHFHRAEEPAPIRPVECGIDGYAGVSRLIAEQPPV